MSGQGIFQATAEGTWLYSNLSFTIPAHKFYTITLTAYHGYTPPRQISLCNRQSPSNYIALSDYSQGAVLKTLTYTNYTGENDQTFYVYTQRDSTSTTGKDSVLLYGYYF